MNIRLKTPALKGDSYNAVSKHDSPAASLSSEYKFFYLIDTFLAVVYP